MKKAFHQIKVREYDRDFMRFHWIKDLKSREIETLRFTRVLFGMNQSPFLLGGTLETHLDTARNNHNEVIISEIKDSTYVDDIISGGFTITETKALKQEVKLIFQEGRFELHKWHSNIQELEEDTSNNSETESTKILGVTWNKRTDKLIMSAPAGQESNENSKRNVLKTLASIYDPLGFISPFLLKGKLIYRNACDLKEPWDKPLPPKLKKRWEDFKEELNFKIEVPRSICTAHDLIEFIDLHPFGDAS